MIGAGKSKNMQRKGKPMQKQGFFRGRKLPNHRGGNSTPLTVALVLALLMVVCVMAEFFRLMIIVQGVRDGVQQAVIAVMTTNYDEAYNGLREGYSGGYVLSGGCWVEKLDYSDVYHQLDSLLGTEKRGSYHVKVQAQEEGGYEYRLSGLEVKITNTPLTPGNANRNMEADVKVTIEVPFSFGWGFVPPFTMQIRTKAAYMPKF